MADAGAPLKLTGSQSACLDMLRYMASLMVVGTHLLAHFYPEQYAPYRHIFHTSFGAIGVSIFFVLSGFLIAYTIIRKSAANPSYDFAEYMVERFVRIYIVFAPVLFLMLTIRAGAAIAGVGAVVDPMGSKELVNLFTLKHFGGTLFMLQGVEGFVGPRETFSLMPPAWTLNYEFMYYIVFGTLALALAGRGGRSPGRRLFMWLLSAFALVILSRLVDIGFLTYTWIMGAVMAHLYVRGFFFRSRRGALVYLIVVALAFAAMVSHYGLGLNRWVSVNFIVLMFFGLLMLAGKMELSEKFSWWANRLASYSYSMYLLHFAMIYITFALCQKAGLLDMFPVGSPGRAAFMVLLLLLINIGCYVFSLFTEQKLGVARRYLKGKLLGKGFILSRP